MANVQTRNLPPILDIQPDYRIVSDKNTGADGTGTLTVQQIIDAVEADLGALAFLDQVNTAEIVNNAVTNAKIAQMPSLTFKANALGVTADPQDIDVVTARTILGLGSVGDAGTVQLADGVGGFTGNAELHFDGSSHTLLLGDGTADAEIIATAGRGAAEDGTVLTIQAADGGATSGNGAVVNIIAGSAPNGDGGYVYIAAGSTTLGNANGGLVQLQGGNGGPTGGNGGKLHLVAGDAGASGANTGRGGDVELWAGLPHNDTGSFVDIRASDGVGTNKNGGDITITSGQGSTGGGVGGDVDIKAGSRAVTGRNGGAVLIAAGDTDSTSIPAGAVMINAGAGVAGLGGNVTITGGETSHSVPNDDGGHIRLIGGDNTQNSGFVIGPPVEQTYRRGDITLKGGNGFVGGIVELTAGDNSNCVFNAGGYVALTGGNGTNDSPGGYVALYGGNAVGGEGGSIEFFAGEGTVAAHVSMFAGNSPVDNAPGGDVVINGGINNGVGTDGDGGNIILTPGVGTGTGLSGRVQFVNSFTDNGTVATSITSLGPSGASTTIKKWLTIKDDDGLLLYIPCF